MNGIIFDGRLVRDPETEVLSTGVECVKFTVANERRKSKDDKQTNYFNCKAFGKTGQFVAQYFRKGAPIQVKGELEVKSYDGKDGTKKTAVTVWVDKAEFTIGKAKAAETVSSEQMQDINMDELPF